MIWKNISFLILAYLKSSNSLISETTLQFIVKKIAVCDSAIVLNIRTYTLWLIQVPTSWLVQFTVPIHLASSLEGEFVVNIKAQSTLFPNVWGINISTLILNQKISPESTEFMVFGVDNQRLWLFKSSSVNVAVVIVPLMGRLTWF